MHHGLIRSSSANFLARRMVFDIPTAPGIGIEMNEEVLRENPPVERRGAEGYSRQAPWRSKLDTEWV